MCVASDDGRLKRLSHMGLVVVSAFLWRFARGKAKTPHYIPNMAPRLENLLGSASLLSRHLCRGWGHGARRRRVLVKLGRVVVVLLRRIVVVYVVRQLVAVQRRRGVRLLAVLLLLLLLLVLGLSLPVLVVRRNSTVVRRRVAGARAPEGAIGGGREHRAGRGRKGLGKGRGGRKAGRGGGIVAHGGGRRASRRRGHGPRGGVECGVASARGGAWRRAGVVAEALGL